MNRIPVLLAVTLSVVCAAARAGAPMPVVAGNALEWPAVSATAINVHRGDGSYVESLPGSATSWTASEPGDYYLVAANDGDWPGWPRSATVTVTVAPTGHPFAEPDPDGDTTIARIGYPAARDAADDIVSATYLNLYFDLEEEIESGILEELDAGGDTVACPGGGTASCASDVCVWFSATLTFGGCVVDGRTLSGELARTAESFPIAIGGVRSVAVIFDAFGIDAGSEGRLTVAGNAERRTTNTSSGTASGDRVVTTNTSVRAEIVSARFETASEITDVSDARYTETSDETVTIGADSSTSTVLRFDGAASAVSSRFDTCRNGAARRERRGSGGCRQW